MSTPFITVKDLTMGWGDVMLLEHVSFEVERGEIFQPKNTYQVGQRLVFPSYDFAIGEVVDEQLGAVQRVAGRIASDSCDQADMVPGRRQGDRLLGHAEGARGPG